MALTHFGTLPTAVTGSAATVKAGSTTLDTVIVTIAITNYTTSVATINLSIATSTTVSDATALGKTLPIPPLTTVVLRGPFVIKAAGTAVNLNASGTASALNLVVSGYTF